MAGKIEKYGMIWPADVDALQIEMYAIQKGGRWTNKKGEECGHGLPFHYGEMRKIIWPELDEHRWNIVCRDSMLENKVCVLMGPGSSGKTHTGAWVYLCEWFCFPEETCVLVSSTDMRGLKLRIWGEITSLWERAVQRFDYLPGHLLDSKCAISFESMTDGDLDDRKVRDMRKGIIGIPTVQGGKNIGLGKWVGVKQKRVRLLADEAQFMTSSFLSAFSNLNKNEDFRATIMGNPVDMLDPLGRAAEPIDGWDGHMEPERTEVWRTRFMNGICVNLIGTDSPNFDYPADEPTRYKYLISREKIADTLSFFPKDSIEYYSQCVGAMKVGQMTRRVLTRRLCEQNEALSDKVNWDGTRTKIFAIDAAYGGDRAVGGYAEFGRAVGGKIMLLLYPPSIIPISVKIDKEPEYQIAEWVKNECTKLAIPAENVWHDSTGRGSLGTAMARVWNAMTNPLEFGGNPSKRPVSLDLYIFDPKLRRRRLKLCDEHYSKKVTELWFSVRYSVESGQLRGMTEETMEEFALREWRRTKDDRVEIERKDEMKERIGRSPDLADWASIIVEGARQRGFNISKLGQATEEKSSSMSPFEEAMRRKQQMLAGKQLQRV
jgi:hypothetical protein